MAMLDDYYDRRMRLANGLSRFGRQAGPTPDEQIAMQNQQQNEEAVQESYSNAKSKLAGILSKNKLPEAKSWFGVIGHGLQGFAEGKLARETAQEEANNKKLLAKALAGGEMDLGKIAESPDVSASDLAKLALVNVRGNAITPSNVTAALARIGTENEQPGDAQIVSGYQQRVRLESQARGIPLMQNTTTGDIIPARQFTNMPSPVVNPTEGLPPPSQQPGPVPAPPLPPALLDDQQMNQDTVVQPPQQVPPKLRMKANEEVLSNLSKDREGYLKTAEDNATLVSQLQTAEPIVQAAKTGQLAPLRTTMQAYASALGLPINMEELASAQSIEALMAPILAQNIKAFGSGTAISDRDLLTAQAQSAQLGKSEAANNIVMAFLRNAAWQKMSNNIEQLKSVAKSYGDKGATDASLENKIQQLEKIKSSLTGPTALVHSDEDYQKLPPGTRFLDMGTGQYAKKPGEKNG
ncbi:MAG: hypothetical protein AB7F19_07685 [Candidatus Babeliales bacterium]